MEQGATDGTGGYLIFLRHGQSQWNEENRFTGWQDSPLTELGRQEAKYAGQKLLSYEITHVYTSPLQRASETIDIAVAELPDTGLRAEKVDALIERNYGELTGLNKAETQRLHGKELVSLWRRSYDLSPPGGESLAQVADRVAPFLNRVVRPLSSSGKTVLIGAHGNSIRSALVALHLETAESITLVEIPTGEPLVLKFAGSSYRYHAFRDVS